MAVDGEVLVFPPLDDLLGQARGLAESFSADVDCFSYGRSRCGEKLLALRLGRGPRQVLAYAFPQPDEPLGGTVLLKLAGRLLAEEELRRTCTWTLLPCVDPDGARLNEGWFTRPLDLAGYLRRHYRPPEGEQVEWTFPSDEPAWPWDRPLPETQALMGLLEQIRPQVLFPLHNALLGGAYAFLSAEAASLAAMLPVRWRAWGLPTHLGEPELPFATELAAGVYGLPSLGEMAQALQAWGIADPAGLFRCGAPAYRYGRRFGAPLTVVPELPLFAIPGIDDARLAGRSRREVLLASQERERAIFRSWAALYARAAPLLRGDTVYRRALEAHHRVTPLLMEAADRWLATSPTTDRPATRAELVDHQQIIPYMQLLPWGVLGRALEEEIDRGHAPAACRALLEEVWADLTVRYRAQSSHLDAQVVPLRQLVGATIDIVRTVLAWLP